MPGTGLPPVTVTKSWKPNAIHVDYMDVCPRMMVSVATAMIPFLENDDTNRALMGANMQRQAVPLLKTEAPIVATGMEYKAAVDSGAVVISKHDGVVEHVSADEIILRDDEGESHTYKIIKFLRSNAGTCTNQRPIVNKGDRVARRPGAGRRAGDQQRGDLPRVRTR